MSHLTTVGTGGDVFANSAAMAKYLAFKTTQQVRYVNRYRNSNVTYFNVLWNRLKTKSEDICTSLASAARVAPDCNVVDIYDGLVFEFCQNFFICTV